MLTWKEESPILLLHNKQILFNIRMFRKFAVASLLLIASTKICCFETNTACNRAGAAPPILAESVWRNAASLHAKQVHELVQPGLLSESSRFDAKHPIFNFFIEYYGMKGTKGVRKLKQWSLPTYPVFLQGATPNDLGDILPLRGASIEATGILYCPSNYYRHDTPEDLVRAASAFVWYHTLLNQTAHREPVLHCYNLHEWAMQYHPPGSELPSSGKYQKHVSLRVDRDMLNQAVERNGVCCTHYDALRFFAPTALPFNSIPLVSDRGQQLKHEQPACLHATMDLFKMITKLQPFVSADLKLRCLSLVIMAREMDVAASPYDASGYGIAAIPIETPEGRSEYKKKQLQLLKESQPVRTELITAFEQFLKTSFDEDTVSQAFYRIPVPSS